MCRLLRGRRALTQHPVQSSAHILWGSLSKWGYPGQILVDFCVSIMPFLVAAPVLPTDGFDGLVGNTV